MVGLAVFRSSVPALPNRLIEMANKTPQTDQSFDRESAILLAIV
jgi:hypothetical protein